jgi:hypothetical protein
MKIRNVVLAAVVAISYPSIANAALTLKLSTSSTNADAGGDAVVAPGGDGTLYVWAATASNLTVAGMSFDIITTDPSIVTATSHEISYGVEGDRWFFDDPGDLNSGDLGEILVDDAEALALPGINGTGFSTAGEDQFALLSTLEFAATGLGTTLVDFDFGSQPFSDGDAPISPSDVTFLGGSITAVPEPGSFAVLGLTGLAFGARRYRRKQRAAVSV